MVKPGADGWWEPAFSFPRYESRTPSFTSCGDLDKLHNFNELQFPYLETKGNNNSLTEGCSEGLIR